MNHSIEKGLSFDNFRTGFGEQNVRRLMDLLSVYTKGNHPKDSIVFMSAVSSLNQYVEQHKKVNYDVSMLEKELSKYIESVSDLGGVFKLCGSGKNEQGMNFLELCMNRHSIRTFSADRVKKEAVIEAINLAQNAPSSCNRQPCINRIIQDEKYRKVLISNQYGNRGFGESVNTFVIVTASLEAYDSCTDRNQCYVDGGIYAMNLLYSLHYFGLATCPLSTSLTISQENNIRNAFRIPESECLILIIAVGHYTNEYKVPKSTRYEPQITIF